MDPMIHTQYTPALLCRCLFGKSEVGHSRRSSFVVASLRCVCNSLHTVGHSNSVFQLAYSQAPCKCSVWGWWQVGRQGGGSRDTMGEEVERQVARNGCYRSSRFGTLRSNEGKRRGAASMTKAPGRKETNGKEALVQQVSSPSSHLSAH